MHRIKIKTQFALILGLCTLLIIFVFYSYSTESIKKIFSQEFTARTKQTTESVRLGLEVGLNEENMSSIKTVFDWVKKTESFAWITLYDSDGQKIASFPENVNFDYKVLQNQKKTQSVESDIFIQEDSWTSNLVSGDVYIGFSTQRLHQQELDAFYDSLKGSIFILCVFVIVIIVLVRTIARPLDNLRLVTEKITSGNTRQRVLQNIRGNFEVESLVFSFNKMMDALEVEKKLNEELLLNILPAQIAKRLKSGEKIIADSYENISIIFCDLVGFTDLATKTEPHELVRVLNLVFHAFDDIVDESRAEKIKTIGDAYLAAVGLIHPEINPSIIAVDIAKKMMIELEKINLAQSVNLRLRIGVHSGPVVAGVIGKKKFVFDLWGEAVNLASRLESHGLPGEIQVSKAVVDAIGMTDLFESRGEINIKGVGLMETYLYKYKISN